MRTAALADIAEKIDYGVTASAQKQPIGPKFLRITDIQDDSVDWNSVPYCEASAREVRDSLLAPGDIVFARTGATTGKSYLISQCPQGAIFASYLIRVRPCEEVDPGYLARFFQSSGYWSQIAAKANGAAQPGVNASKLGELVVPLPPLPEQRRIAAILDQAHALRRLRRRSLSRLSDLGQAIFFEMFGDPALNPKGFRMRPLRDVACRFSDGPFGSNLKSAHYVEDGVRVIRLQNIGVNEFVDNDSAFISPDHFASLRKHECLPGDILVGTLGDPNLRACIQPGWLPQALNKADCVQIRVDAAVASNEYVCALLNIPSVEMMAHSLVLGQTRARISMGRLRDLLVPIAPKELQDEFAKVIAKQREKIQLAEKALRSTNVLFASLQHRAFRGEL